MIYRDVKIDDITILQLASPTVEKMLPWEDAYLEFHDKWLR